MPPTEKLPTNLLAVSANSRLVDERLQKLRGGGTRFSEKVKSYLTARFDVDTETGRKPDPVSYTHLTLPTKRIV